jgi:hypothetical protein
MSWREIEVELGKAIIEVWKNIGLFFIGKKLSKEVIVGAFGRKQIG